jgi:DNA-binding protein HU-beta
MNKQEFIAQLARKAKLSKKDAKSAVDTTINLIVDNVKRGAKVTFTGFGTFEAYQRKAGRRFNPQTRRPFQVPAKMVPKFRAGKNFKQSVSRRG